MSILSSVPFGKAVRAWAFICLMLAALSVVAATWAERLMVGEDEIITGSIGKREPEVRHKRIIRSVLQSEPMVIEQRAPAVP